MSEFAMITVFFSEHLCQTYNRPRSEVPCSAPFSIRSLVRPSAIVMPELTALFPYALHEDRVSQSGERSEFCGPSESVNVAAIRTQHVNPI